ncbi:hypothetical protein ID866_11823 [Astraeus odoratus]|nr:hypothetical protein ID866_11823 [Astraeus odoratus]
MEDWELISEASLNPNSEDDEAMASLQKKVKEDHMTERITERRQKCEEEEQRIQAKAEQKAWEKAEQLARQEAEQKKEEEEKAQRAEEDKKEAKEAERAAEAWRRAADRQHKPSMVIPAGGSMCRSASGPSLGTRAPCDSWSKAAGGPTHKQRRMQIQGDNREDDNDEGNEMEGDRDFVVLPALTQEHQDVLGALTMTLSALLKEFKGYHHEQWDLQACQVRGLKALQREMRKANTLKAKELEATTKGKEKAAEVMEESSESGKEEEEVKDGNEGGVIKGEGDNGDGCSSFSFCYVVFLVAGHLVYKCHPKQGVP